MSSQKYKCVMCGSEDEKRDDLFNRLKKNNNIDLFNSPCDACQEKMAAKLQQLMEKDLKKYFGKNY